MSSNNRYQQPCQVDWSKEQEEQKKQDRTILKPLAVFAGVVIAAAAFTHGCMDSFNKTAAIQRQQAFAAQPPLTSEQEEYRKFFAKHGSPAPVEMAKAVTAVKPHNRPVLAAVAVVESNGNPKAVGDGGSSHGAFQVQPRHWSKVSTSPVQQALQAERILEALVESRGSLRCNPRRLRAGLAAYNGGNAPSVASWRYADRVIALSKKAVML